MQISKEVAASFLNSLHDMKKQKDGKIGLDDVASILDSVMKVAKEQMGAEEKTVYYEIRSIAAKIKETKEAKDKGGVSGKSVIDANQELDAVVKATEKATNEILDNAEKIQKLIKDLPEDDPMRIGIEDASTQIFESCNFQDITGQRIKKVVKTLLDIEKSVDNILGAAGVQEKIVSIKDEKSLMNGPQMKAPTQEEIDKLFNSIDVKK